MRNFIVRCLILILVLYAGIVIGVDKANREMALSGYQKDPFQEPVSINKTEDRQIEVKMIENITEQSELDKIPLDEETSINFLSKLGNALAAAVTVIIQKTIDFIEYVI